jgi:hypothetical protein
MKKKNQKKREKARPSMGTSKVITLDSSSSSTSSSSDNNFDFFLKAIFLKIQSSLLNFVKLSVSQLIIKVFFAKVLPFNPVITT